MALGIGIAIFRPTDLVIACFHALVRNVTEMDDIKEYLNIYASALSLRGRRNEMIASNIANAATPNFKARDINFDTEIRKHLRDGPLETTHGNHIPFAAPYSTGQAQYRTPLNPSLDGNTVELSVEQLQFSENATRYQTTLNFLDGRIKGLMSAIRGE